MGRQDGTAGPGEAGGKGTDARGVARSKRTRYRPPLPRYAAFEHLDERLDVELADALELALDAALAVRELRRCDYAAGQSLTAEALRTLLGAAAALATAGELFRRLEGRRR